MIHRPNLVIALLRNPIVNIKQSHQHVQHHIKHQQHHPVKVNRVAAAAAAILNQVVLRIPAQNLNEFRDRHRLVHHRKNQKVEKMINHHVSFTFFFLFVCTVFFFGPNSVVHS